MTMGTCVDSGESQECRSKLGNGLDIGKRVAVEQWKGTGR